VNIRDYAEGPHLMTDDRPFGGGDGMVMKPEPIVRALESVPKATEERKIILLTPQGEPFNQAMARSLAALEQIILVCGRYEGVDERIRSNYVDAELSIGDYILTGGELPAMVVVDAVVRLLPGALGAEEGACQDSFSEGLLEYPQYTRPGDFRGWRVPEALLSGNHEQIRRWRRKESLRRTRALRPDLLARAPLKEEDRALLAEIEAEEAEAG